MATFPVNAVTSFSALFNEKGFGFPTPLSAGESGFDGQAESILVVGGGSNVGKFALQFGKLNGVKKILTIASTANTSTLKELGATHVIDRHQEPADIKAQIVEIVGLAGLTKIYDCVSWDFNMSLSLFSPEKHGVLLILHRCEGANKVIVEKSLDVEARMIIGTASFMQPLTGEFWRNMPGWVENGDLVVGKYRMIEGFNLAAIEEGLDSFRDGKPVTPIVVHPWGVV